MEKNTPGNMEKAFADADEAFRQFDETRAASAHDALAAQQAVDERIAATRESDDADISAERAGFTAAPAPTLPQVDGNAFRPKSFYAPGAMTFGPRDPEEAALSAKTIEARKRAAATPVADRKTITADATPTADFDTAAATRVSEIDNNECLYRLARIFDVPEIKPREMLRNLALVTINRDQYTLPTDRDADILTTTANIAVVAKGLFEFQNDRVTPADALESAICVMNDRTSYPHGVSLKGSMEQRYMLMLAAREVGLDVANPVTESDLDEEVRLHIEIDFYRHLATTDTTPLASLHSPAAAAAEDAEEPLLEQADRDRLADILGNVVPGDERAAPAPSTRHPSPVTKL